MNRQHAIEVTASSPSSETLILQTIAAIAREGFHNVSLRGIAGAAGVSTASIFHFFGSRTGLILAAAEVALAWERDFHAKLLGELEGLAITQASFGTFAASYVAHRVNKDQPRFWLELMFNAPFGSPELSAARGWHQERLAFWTSLLAPGTESRLAPFLPAWTMIEEAYATVLHDEYSFWPLISENFSAIAAAGAGPALAVADASITAWLRRQPQHFAIHEEIDPGSVSGRLLLAAADKIFEDGLSAVSDRSVGKLAGASPSMIAYHFGSSAHFLQRAVWRAMLHEIPQLLDPAMKAKSGRDDHDDWLDVMDSMVRPASGHNAPGFYLGFTRITGQAALLARRQPALHPLIRHLRIIDGSGTFRATRLNWPLTTRFSERTAPPFALWLKGMALINAMLGAEAVDRRAELAAAAEVFADAAMT